MHTESITTIVESDQSAWLFLGQFEVKTISQFSQIHGNHFMAIITFILWSSTEFTARAETNLTNYQVINILESTAGSRFDFNTNKWFFTLKCHDSLAATLTYIGCTVNLLPRSLIAALQVQTQIPVVSGSTLTELCPIYS